MHSCWNHMGLRIYQCFNPFYRADCLCKSALWVGTWLFSVMLMIILWKKDSFHWGPVIGFIRKKREFLLSYVVQDRDIKEMWNSSVNLTLFVLRSIRFLYESGKELGLRGVLWKIIAFLHHSYSPLCHKVGWNNIIHYSYAAVAFGFPVVWEDNLKSEREREKHWSLDRWRGNNNGT